MSTAFRHALLPSPKELVINVTLKCPLKCAHCCFSSDMFQEGHLSFEDVRLAIEQASRVGSFETVHFVGGDPFLHADIMQQAYRYARSLGLGGGATTSAYWAKSYDRAMTTLKPIAEAGLNVLTLSCDDEHAEFVPLSWVVNAATAALDLDVEVRVAVVVNPTSVLSATQLRTDLGLQERSDVMIYEIPLNATGRAAETSSKTAGLADVDLGPCHSALRNFTVTHRGDVQPCCGVLPQYDGLAVGNIATGGVEKAVKDAYEDPLFQWIALKGPTNVLKAMDLGSAGCSGVCEACDRIFSSPKMLGKARRLAEERKVELGTLMKALSVLGEIIPVAGPKLSKEHAS